jgi:hypothetical protein
MPTSGKFELPPRRTLTHPGTVHSPIAPIQQKVELMKIVALLLLGMIASLNSCKGHSSKVKSPAVSCTCGTPKADFEGCAHPLCVRGERNPDNHDCVCGPMKMGGKK